MSLRDKGSKDLTKAEKKQLDRAETGRLARKTLWKIYSQEKVPAQGHPWYRRSR